jgi:hypothetical protein
LTETGSTTLALETIFNEGQATDFSSITVPGGISTNVVTNAAVVVDAVPGGVADDDSDMDSTSTVSVQVPREKQKQGRKKGSTDVAKAAYHHGRKEAVTKAVTLYNLEKTSVIALERRSKTVHLIKSFQNYLPNT